MPNPSPDSCHFILLQMARSIIALTALLALAGCIATSEAQAVTAPQLVSYYNNLTTQAQQLDNYASSITTASAAEFLLGQGPYAQIIQGLGEVAQFSAKAFVSMHLLHLVSVMWPMLQSCFLV